MILAASPLWSIICVVPWIKVGCCLQPHLQLTLAAGLKFKCIRECDMGQDKWQDKWQDKVTFLLMVPRLNIEVPTDAEKNLLV